MNKIVVGTFPISKVTAFQKMQMTPMWNCHFQCQLTPVPKVWDGMFIHKVYCCW